MVAQHSSQSADEQENMTPEQTDAWMARRNAGIDAADVPDNVKAYMRDNEDVGENDTVQRARNPELNAEELAQQHLPKREDPLNKQLWTGREGEGLGIQERPQVDKISYIQGYVAESRASGASWDDINSQLQDKTPAELGYKDDQGLKDRLTAQASRDKALDETPKLEAGGALLPQTRQAYADALLSGETTGPDHFSDVYHGTDHPPVEDMAAQLPSHADFTDHAIGITHDAELPLTADFLRQTKANLIDTWAQTGLTPATLYEAAVNNPAISDALTSPPPPPPPPVEQPKQEAGFFDPLMHGVAAVSSLFQPGGAADPIAVIGSAGKTMLGTIADIATSLKSVPAEAEKQAENAGKPLAERLLTPGALESGINVALSFSPAGLASDAIKGMFRTPAQIAAGAEKAAAKDFVQGTVREQTGLARQEIAQASAALEEFRGEINKGMPEYQKWLEGDALTRSQAPRPMVQNLVDHIEGVSTGVQLDPKSPFAPVAGALRDVYKGIRNTIETDYPDILGSFHEDYYRHMWTDPAKADRITGGGRMGSSASTQQRTLPTLSDGINQGLVPRIADPIDNTIHYVTGMRNFIAQQETLRLGKEGGYVKYSMNGSPPVDGWVPLSGRGSEKQFVYQDAAGVDQIGTQRAYAHPGFAGSYNNWMGKGFYEYPLAGAIYDKLQYGANMLTGLKLSLSGYHAFNIAQESAVAGLADGIGNLAHGELTDAVKQILPSVTIAPQPVKQFLKGRALQEQYLGIQDHGPEMQQITDLFARAGGRATGRGVELIGNDSQMARSFKIWDLATGDTSAATGIASEMKADVAGALRANPDNTALTSGLLKAGRSGALVGKWLGQTMSGVMAPMFENAIPKIKMAAFGDEMSSWLRQNPMASQEAQVGMARKLVDSMDDRFGELVQDNLFWPRWVKQSLNLATISVGWEFGTIRAFGGAASDIAAGQLLSPRARWLYSFPLTMGVMGSAYQYLKTGNLPTQTDTPIQDLIAPRTGGTVKYGAATYPERAQLPGYQKDPEQWYFALKNAPDYTQLPAAGLNIAFNKLSPMWRLGYAGVTGKDPFTGNVIHSHPDVPGWQDYANYVLKEAATPIGIGQLSERRAGTTMSAAERMSGLRPTGENLAAPEAAQAYQKMIFEKQQKDAQRRDASHAQSLEGAPPKPARATRGAKPAAQPVQPQDIPDEESDGPPMPPGMAPAPAAPARSSTHHAYGADGTRKY